MTYTETPSLQSKYRLLPCNRIGSADRALLPAALLTLVAALLLLAINLYHFC